MKVKELIELLEEQNQELEVVFESSDYVEKVKAIAISEGVITLANDLSDVCECESCASIRGGIVEVFD